MSKVLVISTSLRAKSNSDILTESLMKGAQVAGKSGKRPAGLGRLF